MAMFVLAGLECPYLLLNQSADGFLRRRGRALGSENASVMRGAIHLALTVSMGK